MNTRNRQVTITVVEIEIGGKWFNAREVEDVLEGLEEADGFMNRIVINNHDLAVVLELCAVAKRSNKGSYSKGVDFENFQKTFREAIRAA